MRAWLLTWAVLAASISLAAPVWSAGDETCASGPAQAQLLRQSIQHMKADQMLNEMSDLDGANLSLSKVETLHKPDGSISCKALLTLRVMYGAGLRRTIDNNVTYELLTHGEDHHLAVKIQKFATAF